MEFHIARQTRDRYQFDDVLFSLTGNVIFANFHAARVFAQKMNQKRNLVNFPEQAVRAAHVNAMGLVDEILLYLAPGILGDSARGMFNLPELADLERKRLVQFGDVRMIDSDIRILAKVIN